MGEHGRGQILALGTSFLPSHLETDAKKDSAEGGGDRKGRKEEMSTHAPDCEQGLDEEDEEESTNGSLSSLALAHKSRV